MMRYYKSCNSVIVGFNIAKEQTGVKRIVQQTFLKD